MNSYKTIFSSLVAVAILSGCSMAPTLETPQIELPQAHTNAVSIEQMWWKQFNDPILNTLIEEALNNNADIKLSALRVLKARQAYGLSDSALYPTLNATAGGSKQQTSDETYPNKEKGGARYKDFNLGLTLGYEIDFWGKLSSQADSNWASYLSTKAAAQTVRNTLINEIILAYFNLASLDERIRVLDQTALAYQQSYEFRLKQYQLGSTNELLVNQTKAQYNNTLAAKETLLEAKKIQESALAILLGKSPAAFFNQSLQFSPTLPKPLSIPAGLPSSLLENRPDIAEALENLKSKNALIGVEKASYFPSISLTGSYGQQSDSLDNILKSSATRWSFGPSLSVPIFDFGRIKTRVAISETDLQSALVSYEQTVKKAYKEVSDALARQASAQNRIAFAKEEVDAYKKTYSLATTRYDVGATSSLEVIDAQKNLLNATLTLISTQQTLLASQAELFKALGGGWNNTLLLEEK